MDVQQIFDELKRDYAELHKTVEQKAQEAAKGAVDPLIEAKLARINEAINQKEAARDQLLAAMQADINRLKMSSPTDPSATQIRAKHLAQFNHELKAHAARVGRAATEVAEADLSAYEAAWNRYLRGGDRALGPDEVRAMLVGSDPDGGYTVPPATSSRVVERIIEMSPLRQWASVETIGTDSIEGDADLEEADAGWVGETAARPETATPKLGKWKISVHEMYAMPKSTQKLLEDSNRDIQAWLSRKAGNKFARLEATAFVAGTGVSQPRGFTTYPTSATSDTSRAWGTFEHVATGTSGAFGTDPNGVKKLLELIHTLNPAYLRGAAWYMSRTTLSAVRQLTDNSTNGKFVFVPSFQANAPDTLLGYPVRPVIEMPSIAANSLSIAFGDMAETYLIVDRVGLSLLVDPYTDKPNVRFYMRRRVGGDVVNFDTLKFLKFAA
jgi:HK97 family phage major capsid protein